MAFAAVYYWRWPIVLAVVIGAAVTGAGWGLLYRLAAEDKRPDWFMLDLSLNLTFGLIFAVFGAALAWWRLKHRGPVE
ncbi:MAG TPA: hypothetical protein VGD23_00270 [Sphingomicrobium sp.]